jgi:hypothetical protein
MHNSNPMNLFQAANNLIGNIFNPILPNWIGNAVHPVQQIVLCFLHDYARHEIFVEGVVLLDYVRTFRQFFDYFKLSFQICRG